MALPAKIVAEAVPGGSSTSSMPSTAMLPASITRRQVAEKSLHVLRAKPAVPHWPSYFSYLVHHRSETTARILVIALRSFSRTRASSSPRSRPADATECVDPGVAAGPCRSGHELIHEGGPRAGCTSPCEAGQPPEDGAMTRLACRKPRSDWGRAAKNAARSVKPC